MATQGIVPSGVSDASFNNLGKPVTGNTGVANPVSQFPGLPSTLNPSVGAGNGGIISGNPILSAGPLGGLGSGPTAMTSSLGTVPTGETGTPGNVGGVYQGGNGAAVAPVNNGGPGTLLTAGSQPTPGSGVTPTAPGAPNPNNPTAGQTSQQQQELNKQLVDTFGKGEGNLLDTEIANIGSGDSSYLQAYEKAMAGQNAEGLASLQTTLGNEGVSGNSSASAIATADYNSNVTSQEGLQEQQLQMNDEQQLLGLTQGLQSQSAAEVSSGGFLNDLGSVLGAVGKILPGIGAIGGAISGSGGDSNAMAADPALANSVYAGQAASNGLGTESEDLSSLII